MTLPRATLIGITALGVAAIGWADTAEFAPRIAYNGSPSLPIGLYRVAPIDSLRRSDLVVVPVPETYETLSLERRYVGPGAPLIKRVAAFPGDYICDPIAGRDQSESVVAMPRNAHICVLDGTFLINDVPVLRALKVDSAGRPVPSRGVPDAAKRRIFALIEEVQASFDSDISDR